MSGNSIGTAGGSDKQLQYNDGDGFSGIDNGIAGQTLMSNGQGAAPSFQYPPTTVTYAVASAAIAVAPATVSLGSSGALAMTLATPTTPAQDNVTLDIVATTAHAHTVTTAANKINGNKDTVTFAAVGDCVKLKAVGGIWYVLSIIGATLSEV
jgi:hypothetical protein